MKVKYPKNAGSIGERIGESIIWGEGANKSKDTHLVPDNIWVKGKKMTYQEYKNLFNK